MSKSGENPNDCIFLSDEPGAIMKKFKRAVTDSDNEVRFSADKPGISNLLTVYSCVTGATLDESVATFANSGYGDFKTRVGEAVVDALAPFRAEYDRLLADTAYLDGVIQSGAQKAHILAAPTLARVKEAVGLPV